MMIQIPPEFYEYIFVLDILFIVLGLGMMYIWGTFDIDTKFSSFFKKMFDKSGDS